MTISKEQAKNLLTNLFNNNKLTFRDIAALRTAIDAAMKGSK